MTLQSGSDADGKEKNYPPKDDGVLIQNGELMYGLLTKKNVGAS